MAKHEAAFAEIKDYYNDITSKNLDLIKSLKEEVANMKKNEQYNEKLMFEIAQENKRLNEPLQKVCSLDSIVSGSWSNVANVGRSLTRDF